MINVGCCEALDLRKASKGEVVTVGIALHGIGYSFFFTGIVKRWYRVGQTLGVGLEPRVG